MYLHTRSCLTLCDPMDCNPPGSSVHEIFQIRILEWVAVSYSRGPASPGIKENLSLCKNLQVDVYRSFIHNCQNLEAIWRGNNWYIQTTEYYLLLKRNEGFPGGSVVKNPPVMQEMQDLIPGSGRYSGEGNGNLLQYTCLENSMDRRGWWATVHVVMKSGGMT